MDGGKRGGTREREKVDKWKFERTRVGEGIAYHTCSS